MNARTAGIRPRSDRPRVSRRQLIGFVGVGPAAWALTACGGAESDSSPTTTASTLPFADRFAAFAPADEPNGDLAMVEWPDFILQAGGDIQRLYEFQVVNGEIMRYMPCFCGCHLEDGHQNNRDCYIERVNADGSVVFDSMAPT